MNYTQSGILFPPLYPTNASGDDDTSSGEGAFGASSVVEKLFICIGTVGMASNLFVISVILSLKSMRTKLTNIYIVSQSFLDFGSSLFMVATSTADGSIPYGGLAGSLYCKFWITKYPLWSFMDSSTYNLVVLSIERYLEVVHPIWHKVSFTRKKAYGSLVFAWLLGPAVMTTYFFPTTRIENGECFVYAFWPNVTFRRSFIITVIAMQFLVPLFTLIFVYGSIAYILSQRISVTTESDQTAEQTRRDDRWRSARRNTVKTFALVAAAFVCCWSQNQVYFLLNNLGVTSDYSSIYYHFTVVCVFMNCTVNPIIYIFKYREFQAGVRTLMGRWFPSRAVKDDEKESDASTSTSEKGTMVTSADGKYVTS